MQYSLLQHSFSPELLVLNIITSVLHHFSFKHIHFNNTLGIIYLIRSFGNTLYRVLDDSLVIGMYSLGIDVKRRFSAPANENSSDLPI